MASMPLLTNIFPRSRTVKKKVRSIRLQHSLRLQRLRLINVFRNTEDIFERHPRVSQLVGNLVHDRPDKLRRQSNRQLGQDLPVNNVKEMHHPITHHLRQVLLL